MKESFISQVFYKMIEGRNESALAISAAESVLKRIEEVKDRIYRVGGDETVETILAYRFVKRALEQIIDYCRNSSSLVTDEDHAIYYSYAYERLKKAEKMIDEKFSHLDL